MFNKYDHFLIIIIELIYNNINVIILYTSTYIIHYSRTYYIMIIIDLIIYFKDIIIDLIIYINTIL